MDEITIGVQVGNVTISFRTDQKGTGVRESAEAIKRILKSNRSILNSLGRNIGSDPSAVPAASESGFSAHGQS